MWNNRIDKMPIKKEDFLRYLEGLRVANEAVDEERRLVLPLLTIEESQKQYDSLCEILELQIGDPTLARLDAHRLEDKLRARRIFEKLPPRLELK